MNQRQAHGDDSLPPLVVAVFGPTGSGKTDIAVDVARRLGTEVVNCDPAQCYSGFPILTNKPGPEHDAVAPHRMVGLWPLSHEASVAQFSEQAQREVDDLLAQHGSAVVCGGSGLYVRAALYELRWGSESAAGAVPPDPDLRASLHEQYAALGPSTLHARLAARDPRLAARIHPHDTKRLVRALEAAEHQGSVSPQGASMWDALPRHAATYVAGLAVDRGLVRARIDERTEAMFARGLLEEVEGELGPGAERFEQMSATAQKLHGLLDCVQAVRGQIGVEEACLRMSARTRQYAKRQDTFARRWPGLVPLPVDLGSFDAAAAGTLLVARAQSLQHEGSSKRTKHRERQE